MSEFQEKTEAATPKRRNDAREKGQIPRSQELTTAVLLLGAAVLVSKLGPALGSAMVSFFGYSTTVAVAPPSSLTGAAAYVRGFGLRTAAAVAPLLLGLCGIGLAVAAAQARGVLSAQPLRPDFSRISPQKNLEKLLGPRSIAELAKSILKLVVVGGAMYGSLRAAWPEIMVLGQQEAPALAHALVHYTVRLLATAGGAYLVLAAADYAFQLWQHERGLRMTKEEVRQEVKETDGDPQVKHRLRSMARARIRRQMFRDVPKADVVVTNPTHIAVALRYDPEVSPAPIVLAMGERKIAQRIKKLALDSGVPVIENKPLARALLATGRVGLPIPAELYVAVAEVLAFVIRRRSAGAADWAGSAVV